MISKRDLGDPRTFHVGLEGWDASWGFGKKLYVLLNDDGDWVEPGKGYDDRDAAEERIEELIKEWNTAKAQEQE